MDMYRCEGCEYVYYPEKGDPTQDVAPGTPFEELPEDWICPDCGLGKEHFYKL